MINRNDKCWCGSGLKYKKCHLDFDKKLISLRNKGYLIPSRNLIKNEEEIQGIRESAIINNGLLDLISENIREGMTTEEIDKMTVEYLKNHGATSADFNYDGYPKSICTSINEEVCHGIPSENTILKAGDIINVDATTELNGYYSDASRMFIIGEASEEAKKVVRIAKECLEEGIKAVKPWGFLGDVGYAIQKHAEENGCSVVREFGGHGVGLAMHEDPFVSHVGRKGTGMILAPGMVITIEPMINLGKPDIYIDSENGWTVKTVDKSLSAQVEHTLLITESGVEIISK